MDLDAALFLWDTYLETAWILLTVWRHCTPYFETYLTDDCCVFNNFMMVCMGKKPTNKNIDRMKNILNIREIIPEIKCQPV